MRISVASAGNDHRLGANEAPPAIVSIFLGEELDAVINAIEEGSLYPGTEQANMGIGVKVLPDFIKDTTDRNRTSPFAFTGNKFEFRMLGSAQSISGPNIVLNTIVAEELKQFADALEGAADFDATVSELIKTTIKEHKRIIFNGNGYSQEWEDEAARRGLLNLKTTVDALPKFVDEKNIKLFTEHNVFTKVEMESRYEILLETYVKVLNIEALTMIDMVKKDIIPAVSRYVEELAATAISVQSVNSSAKCLAEVTLIEELTKANDETYLNIVELDKLVKAASEHEESGLALATYYKDVIIPAMEKLRAGVDFMEENTSADLWPVPVYGDLLFRV